VVRQDYLSVERRPAVLALEVRDPGGVEEDDVVADTERRGACRVDSVGDDVVVDDFDVRVGTVCLPLLLARTSRLLVMTRRQEFHCGSATGSPFLTA